MSSRPAPSGRGGSGTRARRSAPRSGRAAACRSDRPAGAPLMRSQQPRLSPSGAGRVEPGPRQRNATSDSCGSATISMPASRASSRPPARARASRRGSARNAPTPCIFNGSQTRRPRKSRESSGDSSQKSTRSVLLHRRHVVGGDGVRAAQRLAVAHQERAGAVRQEEALVGIEHDRVRALDAGQGRGPRPSGGRSRRRRASTWSQRRSRAASRRGRGVVDRAGVGGAGVADDEERAKGRRRGPRDRLARARRRGCGSVVDRDRAHAPPGSRRGARPFAPSGGSGRRRRWPREEVLRQPLAPRRDERPRSSRASRRS